MKKTTRSEPEEFRAGENVTDRVRRRGPGGIVVSVRLELTDSANLAALAEESGKTVSQIAREAIRVFLAQRGRRPMLVPEITGNTPEVNISAFVPLGPRTVSESPAEVRNAPSESFRSGRCLKAV